MTPPKATILIAEDTEDIRFLIKFMLEEKNFHVVEAGHGKEVIELAPQIKPDVILMDLNMPVLNGWEATRRLRQMPETRDTPIIGFSAHCRDGWREEALAAGCDDCIQKPIDQKVLDGVLSRFLKG